MPALMTVTLRSTLAIVLQSVYASKVDALHNACVCSCCLLDVAPTSTSTHLQSLCGCLLLCLCVCWFCFPPIGVLLLFCARGSWECVVDVRTSASSPLPLLHACMWWSQPCCRFCALCAAVYRAVCVCVPRVARLQHCADGVICLAFLPPQE